MILKAGMRCLLKKDDKQSGGYVDGWDDFLKLKIPFKIMRVRDRVAILKRIDGKSIPYYGYDNEVDARHTEIKLIPIEKRKCVL